jgi:hypothetical protein
MTSVLGNAASTVLTRAYHARADSRVSIRESHFASLNSRITEGSGRLVDDRACHPSVAPRSRRSHAVPPLRPALTDGGKPA